MNLLYVLYIVLGVLIGVLGTCFYFNAASGTLKIDHSNPAKDVYRIDIKDLDTISRRKRIVLKVDNNADLSQN